MNLVRSVSLEKKEYSIDNVKYLEEMISKYKLDRNDVIIVGSTSISLIGGRLNNDIDVCIRKENYKKMPIKIRFAKKMLDHCMASDEVDFYFDRYVILGITDEMLFENGWYSECDGWKVVIPEIELAYKLKIARPKDIEDYLFIQNNPSIFKCIKWDMVDVLRRKAVSRYFIKKYNTKDIISLAFSKIRNKK